MTFSLILLAAGRGKRMASSIKKPFLKKQFLPVLGMPLYQHSLNTFLTTNLFNQVIVVCAKSDISRLRQELSLLPNKDKIHLSLGGDERYLSVLNGIKALPQMTDFVLIHDAARPLIKKADIFSIVNLAKETNKAVLPCEKVTNTIKETKDGKIVRSLNRENLVIASTPQCMPTKLLLRGYQKITSLDRIPTDDAEIIALMGEEIEVCWLSSPNPKLTTKADLRFIEFQLNKNNLF